MLRTEPAALSLPGPYGAAGFHPRLSQLPHPACCIRKRMRRFHHAGDKSADTLMAPRRSAVSDVFILTPSTGESSLVRSPGGGLVVAPSRRHSRGVMNSAKTFCLGPQKLLSPPLFFLLTPLLLCPLPPGNSPRDGLTTRQEEK